MLHKGAVQPFDKGAVQVEGVVSTGGQGVPPELAWWFFQQIAITHNFYDTFDEASPPVSLDAHTPDIDDAGSGWTEQQGDLVISTTGEVTKA